MGNGSKLRAGKAVNSFVARKSRFCARSGVGEKRSGDGSRFEAVGGDVRGGGREFGDASFGIAVGDGGMRFGGGFGVESANGLVAAGILGLIECAVGKGEDFFVIDVHGRIHIPRESGPADGNGAVQRKARALDLEGFAGNSGENARGERGGFLALAKSGDNEELFTAPTNQDVGIANRGTDARG